MKKIGWAVPLGFMLLSLVSAPAEPNGQARLEDPSAPAERHIFESQTRHGPWPQRSGHRSNGGRLLIEWLRGRKLLPAAD